MAAMREAGERRVAARLRCIVAGYRPGLGALAAYVAGILVCGSLPAVPHPWVVAAAGLIALLFTAVSPWRRLALPVVLAGVIGGSWASWQNTLALENRLPEEAHGADMVLPLRVVSLPTMRPSQSRFGEAAGKDIRFSAEVLETAPQVNLRGKRLDLTWYRAGAEIVDQLQGGTLWSMPVRLKRPRGSVNPHGFDYEGWLLRRGVYATGYVRPRDAEPRILGHSAGVITARQWFRNRILASGLPRTDLILALVLGDRSALSRDDRRGLRDSGTAHLIAISGLHVGMVAGGVALLAALLARLAGLCCGRSPRGLVPGLSLMAAGLYVLLAGAPLSAQRALVMLSVFFLAWYWRRRFHSAFALGLALAIVLTLQPLAFHGPGFWLSFLAVAALLVGFRGRHRLRAETTGVRLPGLVSAGLQRVRDLVRSQWLIGLVLLLPSVAFFHGFSVGGFIFNLLAIPWMAAAIMPLLLVGTLFVGTAPAQWLLGLADAQLGALMEILTGSVDATAAWLNAGLPATGWLLALFGLGILWLMLPAGTPGRALGWVVPAVIGAGLLPSWAPTVPKDQGLQATVLDVGQGLAVVLRANGSTLVYDAGPGRDGGWSAGGQIVAPFLLGEGERVVDLLVLSHGDSDHAGGFAGLAELLPARKLVAPGQLVRRAIEQFPETSSSRCVAGQTYRLDAMHVSGLWPVRLDLSGEENDHSCVALIEWGERRILLVGDISSAVERQLARRYPEFAPVDLLVAPHHGSRSSSSEALLRWSRPGTVVFSAGYRHHFGHPHPEVVARYQRHGTRIFSTAESGAVSFLWQSASPTPVVQTAREQGPFWVRH
ncbi:MULTISPECIES: DNA internalization-related competence protein ComEC/Rec2 [Microbulbifer]|nr:MULTISPECIES: DNA internalization-related competence protein ComEC/Rec2 [Microbulbifer]